MKETNRKKKTKEEIVKDIKEDLRDIGELDEDQMFALLLLAKSCYD